MRPEGLVAADMGGSFLKFAVVVPAETDHATVARTFARIPMSDRETRRVSDVLADAIRQALTAAKSLRVSVTGIGVCSPGPFDWQRGVSLMQHKFLSIRGLDLKALVRERLAETAVGVPSAASLPVRIVPDSYAFAAGEHGFGAARRYSRCLYITLGTGIGSALSREGRIFLRLPGKSPDGSIWCAPYRDGITEDYVSKRAILKAYRLEVGASSPAVGDAADLDVDVIADRARAGDRAALDVFHEFGRHLGAALHLYAGDFDPQCIIVGGGLAPCFPLFEADVLREVKGMTGLSTVAVSVLGEKGPLLGIAATFADGYRES